MFVPRAPYCDPVLIPFHKYSLFINLNVNAGKLEVRSHLGHNNDERMGISYCTL